MKTAVVYITRYGSTGRCAADIAECLGDDADVFELRGRSGPDLGGYDAVVIGGPVYGGTVPAGLGRFCEKARELLLTKRVGLFVCCLYAGEKAEQELYRSYPEWLTAHAIARAYLGGAIKIDNLKRTDRFLIRRMAGLDHDVDTIDSDRIQLLCRGVSELR